MSTFKAAKPTSVFTLMLILLVFVSSLALAGEKSGYLGIMLQDINTGMAKAMDLDNEDGVLISEVVDGSPAQEAGLQDGDVIIQFKGRDLDDHKALTKAVGSTSPGEKVEVVVLRNGRKKTIEVELGEREDNRVFYYDDDDDDQYKVMINGLKDLRSERGFMGVELDDISRQMGEFFEVEDGKGALITSVNEDSAAEKSGLKAGDVIIRIGDEEVRSAGDVHEALAGTEPEQKLEILVIRKGKKKTLDITLGEVPENQMFKHLEIFQGKHNFPDRLPKKFYHGMQMPHRMNQEKYFILDGEDELKEMRHELEKMKKELKEMKKDLKK